MDALRLEIESRLRDGLLRLAEGDDLPPAWQFRLEGLCEAAVLLGLATPAELDARFVGVQREVRAAEPTAALDGRWREDHPFPELPLYARRAPVSPSTRR
jgi:hypothetical protein